MASYPDSLLILNGKSAGNDLLRQAITELREDGARIHVRVTFEKGDAARYIDEGIRLGAETIISGGGDGTINEIAGALIDLNTAHRPVMGIAQVNDQTCFINMATGGFGTRITSETPEKLKAALGGVSYLIHGLMRMDTLKPDSCEISGENFHWQGDALVIGIGNGRQAGGGQQLCPEALINDGQLQLRIFTGDGLLPALFTTLTQPAESPNIIDGKSAWFEVVAPNGMTFNLDGEPLSGDRFRIEVVPGALQCRLPPDCPLLR